MSEFNDWHTIEVEDRIFDLEPIDIAEEAFNAGLRIGEKKGRKLQREKDAVIAEQDDIDGCTIGHGIAKAIREQEITDK